MEYSCHLELDDLQTYVKQVLGEGYWIANVQKMQGGAQKSVYRIECGNGFICVLYVWDVTNNYFQEEIELEQPEERSFGGRQFASNNAFLTQLGIRTPALYHLNSDREAYPFDYALVEYVDGERSDRYFDESLQVQHTVFQRLSDMLARMHNEVRPAYGMLAAEKAGTGPCHRSLLHSALEDLIYASRYIPDIATHRSKLTDTIQRLEAAIMPRQRYGFIHGELGPDHVFVNDKLEPCLIDIEGAHFFDIEYEHSFLEFRFGEHYRYLQGDSLDPARMLFYKMYHHASCTAGGLKLLHRGFPDRKLAGDIVAYNHQAMLKLMDSRI